MKFSDDLCNKISIECENSSKPWGVLARYGVSDTIEFEFYDGVWKPKEEQAYKLDLFD
jgi:hypothetical protein